nr:MAG TPA: hypothetical protein [Microviridae sp.]
MCSFFCLFCVPIVNSAYCTLYNAIALLIIYDFLKISTVKIHIFL